jgi:hypothetical protein
MAVFICDIKRAFIGGGGFIVSLVVVVAAFYRDIVGCLGFNM